MTCYRRQQAADLKQSLIDVSVDDIDMSGGKPSDRGGDGAGGGRRASPRPAGAATAAAAVTEAVASLGAAGAGAGGAGAADESGSRRGPATGEGRQQLPPAAAAVAAVAREAEEAASPPVAAAGLVTDSGRREVTAVEGVERIPPTATAGGLNGSDVGQGEGEPGSKVDAGAVNGSGEGRAASNGGGEDSAGGGGGGGLVTRAIPRRPLREMLR